MKKMFVLDTNVLLADPEAVFSFEDNDIVIPLAVVEEIDDQKKKNNDIGFNARETSRLLDNLRQKGRLNEGVKLPGGGTLKIIIDKDKPVLPVGLSPNKMDNRIISTAIKLNGSGKERDVILVSNDINIRLIADAFGLLSEEYRSNKIEKQSMIFTGFKEIRTSSRKIDDFYQNKGIKPEEIEGPEKRLFANEPVQLTAGDRDNHTVLAMYDGTKLRPLKYTKQAVTGISARNREQQFAFELLLDDEINLVTLAGKAGTGKTLLALAAGLKKVVEQQKYNRLLVARPVVPMGSDLGFLPGTKEEKLQPWMQPIFDNLDFIFKQYKNTQYSFQRLLEKDLLQIEALTYIRGRSVPDQFIIIDEAQNLSKHEVKTIITRAGDNTKIVLTGDPYQIDNPYLDLQTNGLSYLAHQFYQQNIAGHVMLKKGERSELARLASELL